MAVMAMTAMSHAVTFQSGGFTAKANADVSYVQSIEEGTGDQATTKRTTNQFLVRGSLTFVLKLITLR